ncbi:MAG: D-cysteine desulfhydrase [Alphaproteobacteria bacterium]
MNFDQFPRSRFCHLPTPLEPLPRLSAHLGGPSIWVKRDDATGLALGGNKARKLEFLVGAAQAEGADALITAGAPQSNHCRQTAAAAARHGLACHLVLQDKVAYADRDLYMHSGNILLDRLTGARVHMVAGDTDADAQIARVAVELRNAGGRPYAIPIGGSNAVGALGYAAAGRELLDQAQARGVKVDAVFHASGSGGTQGGLLAGIGGEVPVVGICVGDPSAKLGPEVMRIAREAAARLGRGAAIADGLLDLRDGFVGPAYGQPTEGMVEAVGLCARLEGLIIDPVYTGKAMAGLIAAIRAGEFVRGQNVVFVHTGGTPALFVYHAAFGAA